MLTASASPSVTLTTRYNLIAELTQLALRASDVPSAVTPVLEALVTHTDAVGSAYFQSGAQVFTARAASGVMPEGPVMEHILTHGLPDETPLFRALAEREQPLFFNNTGEHTEAAGFPELNVASLAAAPVCNRDGALIGAFLMHTFEQHTWTSRETELFATVAGTLATLAARLVMEERLLETRANAVRALGLALDYKDNDTKGHTDRVTELALAVAREMGVTDEAQLESIRLGAYLHDIGKIGIPDAVLLKPGKLSDAEWITMKTHTAVGHTFAGKLGFIPPEALELILHHHERWAGGGYPAGLSGEAIPLHARIFSVADVYDALTSERPYKRAWTHEEALNEIIRQSAQQFDPAVVEAFLRLSERASVQE